MNIEEARDYLLSLPEVTEDMPFDETTITFRIVGKIFACLSTDRPEWLTLKCDPDKALDLRREHSEVEPAYHWNKKHWIQVNMLGNLPDSMLHSLMRHAFACVVAGMTRKLRAEHPNFQDVKP